MAEFTKEQLTDERLAKILSETQAVINERNAHCKTGGSVEVNARLFESMLAELQRSRQLLAGIEQEPVYQVLGDGSWTDYSKQQLEDLLESKPSTLFRVAYAAPQLPQPAVVPSAELLSAMEEVLRISDRDHEAWHRARKGIADFRAALLQGAEPVSQPFKLRDGWVAVPVEPTEDMVIAGFEAELREEFHDPEAWEVFEAMSGCEQAAHRAKWCWAAMIAAAPQKEAS